MRIDQRALDQLREVKITRNYTRYAEGSVLVEFGHTKFFVLQVSITQCHVF